MNEMLTSLCDSLQDDIWFLLQWREHWPENIEFPEEDIYNEKKGIVHTILDIKDELEALTLSKEKFGPFWQVTAMAFFSHFISCILCSDGWYLAEESVGLKDDEKGIKDAIHLMLNRETENGIVLLVNEWKFYKSDEFSEYEARKIYDIFKIGVEMNE